MTTSVDFQVIPKLQEGETLVVNVDVGNLPTKRAEEYVASIKENFLKTRNDPASVQYFFVPKRS